MNPHPYSSIPKSWKLLQEIIQPELLDFDLIRQENYRPQIGIFPIADKKLLLVHYRKYDQWGIIQGGIENNENIKQSIYRELNEEVGPKFSFYIKNDNFQFLNEFRVSVPKEEYINHPDLSKRNIIGKHFFNYSIELTKQCTNISNKEFDKLIWCKYTTALKLIGDCGGDGKKEMIYKCVNILKDNNVIN